MTARKILHPCKESKKRLKNVGLNIWNERKNWIRDLRRSEVYGVKFNPNDPEGYKVLNIPKPDITYIATGFKASCWFMPKEVMTQSTPLLEAADCSSAAFRRTARQKLNRGMIETTQCEENAYIVHVQLLGS